MGASFCTVVRAVKAVGTSIEASVKFAALFPTVSVPLVIRTPSGGRRGYGPTHSQSPENIITSVPGLTGDFLRSSRIQIVNGRATQFASHLRPRPIPPRPGAFPRAA